MSQEICLSYIFNMAPAGHLVTYTADEKNVAEHICRRAEEKGSVAGASCKSDLARVQIEWGPAHTWQHIDGLAQVLGS